MRARTAFLSLAIAAGLAAGLGYVLLDHGFLRFNYPAPEQYPVRGIDISHHQGAIDWTLLERQGVQFVYMKASEGATMRDDQFLDNWAGSRKAGLAPGAYHYYSFCAPPLLQAQNFLDSAPPSPYPALPPAVDLEYAGNCQQRPSSDQFEKDVRTFLDAVEGAWNRRAVLYVTDDFYAFAQQRFPDNPVWVRSIYAHPSKAGFDHWRIWQYANRGRLDGVGTVVDLNVFRGSRADFRLFIEPQRPADPIMPPKDPHR